MRVLTLSIPLMFGACSLINMFPDNPIEEKIEDFIQAETGIFIDFTGSSPES